MNALRSNGRRNYPAYPVRTYPSFATVLLDPANGFSSLALSQPSKAARPARTRRVRRVPPPPADHELMQTVDYRSWSAPARHAPTVAANAEIDGGYRAPDPYVRTAPSTAAAVKATTSTTTTTTGVIAATVVLSPSTKGRTGFMASMMAVLPLPKKREQQRA